jgi:Leucine-rich repeat (LRR) protein
MKNTLIAILVIVVLGLGGWLIYDKTKHTATPAGSSNSSISSQSSSGSRDAKVLDYSHRNLTNVGSDIYKQADATQLILSNNSLSSLPSQMGAMDKLQVLKLDHNVLQGSLIAEIRKMPLITLDVSYNNMTGVPAEIGQISTLQTLNYSYNKITAFPNEIANIKQLKTLTITGNPLSADKVTQLKAELPNTTIIF